MKRIKYSPLAILFVTLLAAGFASCKSGQTQTVPSIPEHPVSSPAPPPPESPLETTGTLELLTLAAGSLEQSDYSGALAFFDAITTEDADKAEIQLLKASVLLSAGKLEEAESIAGAVLQNTPNHVEQTYIEALLVLASVEEARNKSREQRTLLEQALALEPENTRALTAMGKLMIRTSAAPLAGPYFDKVLALEPENGEALLGRAWVYRNARDPKNAEALLIRAVELYPEWENAVQERGRLYKALGRNEVALADLARARELAPDNYFIACDLGGALQNLGRKTDALAEYERASKLNPNHFLAYVYSAGLKDELGDREGAFNDYAALARLNPDYYFAFEGLGLHLARLSRWLEARGAFVEAYRRAVHMDASKTDEGTYALLAALSWHKSGSSEGARSFIDEALKRLPRDSFEYRTLLVYRDGTGDAELAARADREQDLAIKARLLFYLAWYYDIRGNKNLANKLFVEVKELDVKTITEWRLNEWTLEARGVAPR